MLKTAVFELRATVLSCYRNW